MQLSSVERGDWVWSTAPYARDQTAARGSSVVTPTTSNRLPAAALRTLDAYAETVLACPPGVARRGGVHLLGASRRGLPAWHGFTMPIVGLSFASGAVIACRPDLVERLRAELGSDIHQPYLDGPAFRRLWRAVQRCAPNGFTLAGDLRAADVLAEGSVRTLVIEKEGFHKIMRETPSLARFLTQILAERLSEGGFMASKTIGRYQLLGEKREDRDVVRRFPPLVLEERLRFARVPASRERNRERALRRIEIRLHAERLPELALRARGRGRSLQGPRR